MRLYINSVLQMHKNKKGLLSKADSKKPLKASDVQASHAQNLGTSQVLAIYQNYFLNIIPLIVQKGTCNTFLHSIFLDKTFLLTILIFCFGIFFT